jgi:hypothetical protein
MRNGAKKTIVWASVPANAAKPASRTRTGTAGRRIRLLVLARRE